MSDFFEIAYAAASKRLCLFTGTGFSRAVTSNKAPSWQSLLECLCNLTGNSAGLRSALFPAGGPNPLSLEEAAQIISIELLKTGKKIHDEVANQIKQLSLSGDNSVISDFLSKKSLRVVTTNYDKLAEQLAGEDDCHSLTPGLPIPRSEARIKIYHVHGSIDSPNNMVITSDDYFKFINGESYFSRKLSTVLHENTIVILGYSLGDTNLKAIVSDYRAFSRSHVISSNLFLVSRSNIDQHIKDYYSHCYGIRVLDGMEIHDFFRQLNKAMPEAEKCAESSIDNIRKVLFQNHSFESDYLKVENSFLEIISSLGAIGRGIGEPVVVSALGKIIQTKIDLTTKNGAWDQYEHLARWLIHLANILELKGTSIEDTYLNAALQSMITMRREFYFGYSWNAFKSWKSGWSGMIASNRAIIKNHIEKNTKWPDALLIVNSG